MPVIHGVQFTYLYHDIDIIEVRIDASNGRFMGSVDVYVGRDYLGESASILVGFPKDSADTRELLFGGFGPKFAGGAARFRFYCNDNAGHTALEVSIEDGFGQRATSQNVTLIAKIEPAAIDTFIAELRSMQATLKGSATLSFHLS